MTLHSLTKSSLAVLNHKILEAKSQVQNVKLGSPYDMLRRPVRITAPEHHGCSTQE